MAEQRYWISEAQLERLSQLNPEWPDEVAEGENLVAQIRTQKLEAQ